MKSGHKIYQYIKISLIKTCPLNWSTVSKSDMLTEPVILIEVLGQNSICTVRNIWFVDSSFVAINF